MTTVRPIEPIASLHLIPRLTHSLTHSVNALTTVASKFEPAKSKHDNNNALTTAAVVA